MTDAPTLAAVDDAVAAVRLALRLDGAPISAVFRDAVAGVRLVQRACLPAQLTVDLEGQGGPRPPVEPGAALTLETADQGGGGTALFAGVVTGVEHSVAADRHWALQLRAYDALHRLQRRRVAHSLDAGDLATAANVLAQPYGLETEDWPDRALPTLVLGHGGDDLAMLRKLAITRGVYFHVDGDHLRAFTLDNGPLDAAAPVMVKEGLVRLRVERNTLAAWQERRVDTWDLQTLNVNEDSEAGRASAVAGDAARFGGLFEGAADGRARATARALEDAQRAARVSGIVDGDPRLRPGVRVTIEHPDLDAPVETTVFETVHRLDPAAGYVTEFTNVPPLEPEDGHLELAFGEVCEVDDDAPARARLQLAWLDGLETGWLPVVIPGAGAEKGMVALPEVGDHVACLLYSANPARGMILGGLFAEAEVPMAPRQSGRDRAFIVRTARGQRLKLDDSAGEAELRNRAGSLLELTPNRVRLHADADLELAAPGKRIVIRAARVDFEEA